MAADWRDMSMARTEFARVMQRLGAQLLSSCDDAESWQLEGAVIETREMPPLRRGALTLPRLAVRMNFGALPREQARQLEERLRQAFQRGGG